MLLECDPEPAAHIGRAAAGMKHRVKFTRWIAPAYAMAPGKQYDGSVSVGSPAAVTRCDVSTGENKTPRRRFFETRPSPSEP